MATARRASSGRERGEIETLSSGSLRVKVYAGIDPLSGKRHYLTETVPTGPRALAEAKKARTRLIGQVDEQRNPRTRATVAQLMDRYLDVLNVEVTTRARYEAAIRLHVRPLLGGLPVAKLTGETIDAFQAGAFPERTLHHRAELSGTGQHVTAAQTARVDTSCASTIGCVRVHTEDVAGPSFGQRLYPTSGSFERRRRMKAASTLLTSE